MHVYAKTSAQVNLTGSGVCAFFRMSTESRRVAWYNRRSSNPNDRGPGEGAGNSGFRAGRRIRARLFVNCSRTRQYVFTA